MEQVSFGFDGFVWLPIASPYPMQESRVLWNLIYSLSVAYQLRLRFWFKQHYPISERVMSRISGTKSVHGSGLDLRTHVCTDTCKDYAKIRALIKPRSMHIPRSVQRLYPDLCTDYTQIHARTQICAQILPGSVHRFHPDPCTIIFQ